MESYEIFFFITWLVSGFLNGVCGLGGALVAVPVAATFLQPAVLTPVTGIIATSVCMHQAWIFRKCVRYSTVKNMLLGAAPGAAAGVSVLLFVRPQYIQLVTGIVMVLFMLQQLFAKNQKLEEIPEKTIQTLFVGFIVGMLTASIGISNPTIGAYALHLGWAQGMAVGSMNVISVIAYLIACCMQIASGLYTAEVVKLIAIGVPAAMIGSFCAIPVAKKLPVQTFRFILRLIIMFGGVVCMWRGISNL